MTIKALLPILFITLPISTSLAQVVKDDFADGNFTENPAWEATNSSFIVNEELQLQLDYQPADLQPAFISTAFTPTNLDDKEWRFDVKLDFAPSGGNKIVIYLASSTTNLLDYENTGSMQEGYFLEIGENGSDDAVSLFYRNGTSSTLIARGDSGQFSDAFEARIRVRREKEANWEIAVADFGSENFTITATGADNNFNTTENLGFICYFTSTRRDKFFFDNVYFGDYIFDTIPPQIVSTTVTSNNSVQLLASEVIDPATAISANFQLSPGDLPPENVTVNNDSIFLQFASNFISGTEYTLSVNSLSDLAGNILTDTSSTFFYFEVEEADVGDVIISEFFPDPTPAFGLPEAEFVELYNRSDKYVSLKNWGISDNSSSEGILPEFILAPQQFVILTTSSSLDEYQALGQTISPSSWPALNNGGDSITIFSGTGKVIDALVYTSDWYQDEEKAEGGYSLELINPNLNCFDASNWIASESATGGTPGSINAVNDASFIGSAPEITDFSILGSDSLIVIFDKSMDLNSLQNATYNIDPSISISEVIVSPENQNKVLLILSSGLSIGEPYLVSIDNVADCNGNLSESLSFDFVFDNIAPTVSELILLSDSILLIQFDDPLEVNSAEEINNFELFPDKIITEAFLLDKNEVVLILEEALMESQQYELTISGVTDVFGNELINYTNSFTFENPAAVVFNELMITEVMPNPVTDQALPNAEYVEIYNSSNRIISLAGMKYSDSRDTTLLGINYVKPGEYLILCPTSNSDQFESYGRRLGLSPWLNLNNSGDELQLMTADHQIVHQTFYNDSWYKEEFKTEEGGWSLEMIDTNNPCEGFSNWTASRAELKGSPGAENSVKEDNRDSFGPQIEKAFAPSETEVIVYFNEPVNINKIRTDQFAIEPLVAISTVEIISTQVIRLQLDESLTLKTLYNISANNLTDCAGNIINTENNSVAFSLVEDATQNDLVLNEVLYDPRSGGVDFIEFYNRSDKFINLNNWLLRGTTEETILFPDDNIVMAPGDILAITSDLAALVEQYPLSAKQENIVQAILPSFPNEEGLVQIISASGNLEEYFEYSDDFHVTFLRSVEGVSLERISPEAAIEAPDSWVSAASTSGYATPGTINSQLTTENTSFGAVEANPKTFAHNAPGRNYTLINYEIEDAGNLATVKIFDVSGTLIKTLANNETLNTTGFYRWDGDDEQGRKVRTGYYLVYFELFSSNGNTQVIKERVAVGANF